MKRRGKRKSYPKTHKFAIGDKVVFVFAGSKRIGNIIEKTWEEVEWRAVKKGDILRIEDDQSIPADLVLLQT